MLQVAQKLGQQLCIGPQTGLKTWPYVIMIRRVLPFLALTASALAANICGQVGYHDESKISYYMGNFFYKGPSSFALCASYCKKDAPRCKSFRYSYYSDAAGQYCEFFEDILDGNFIADNSQPYYYYDIGCAFPPYCNASTSVVTSRIGATTITQVLAQTETQARTTTVTSTQQETRTVTSKVSGPTTTQFATQTQIRIWNVTSTFVRPGPTIYSVLSSLQTNTIQRTVTVTMTPPRLQSATSTTTRTVTSVSARTRTVTSTSVSTRLIIVSNCVRSTTLGSARPATSTKTVTLKVMATVTATTSASAAAVKATNDAQTTAKTTPKTTAKTTPKTKSSAETPAKPTQTVTFTKEKTYTVSFTKTVTSKGLVSTVTTTRVLTKETAKTATRTITQRV